VKCSAIFDFQLKVVELAATLKSFWPHCWAKSPFLAPVCAPAIFGSCGPFIELILSRVGGGRMISFCGRWVISYYLRSRFVHLDRLIPWLLTNSSTGHPHFPGMDFRKTWMISVGEEYFCFGVIETSRISSTNPAFRLLKTNFSTVSLAKEIGWGWLIVFTGDSCGRRRRHLRLQVPDLLLPPRARHSGRFGFKWSMPIVFISCSWHESASVFALGSTEKCIAASQWFVYAYEGPPTDHYHPLAVTFQHQRHLRGFCPGPELNQLAKTHLAPLGPPDFDQYRFVLFSVICPWIPAGFEMRVEIPVLALWFSW